MNATLLSAVGFENYRKHDDTIRGFARSSLMRFPDAQKADNNIQSLHMTNRQRASRASKRSEQISRGGFTGLLPCEGRLTCSERASSLGSSNVSDSAVTAM